MPSLRICLLGVPENSPSLLQTRLLTVCQFEPSSNRCIARAGISNLPILPSVGPLKLRAKHPSTVSSSVLPKIGPYGRNSGPTRTLKGNLNYSEYKEESMPTSSMGLVFR